MFRCFQCVVDSRILRPGGTGCTEFPQSQWPRETSRMSFLKENLIGLQDAHSVLHCRVIIVSLHSSMQNTLALGITWAFPIQISKVCDRSAITNVSILVHMYIFEFLDGMCAFPSHHPSGNRWFCLNILVSLPPASSDICHDIGCDDGRLCEWRSSFDYLLVPCRIRVISNKLHIPVERIELN